MYIQNRNKTPRHRKKKSYSLPKMKGRGRDKLEVWDKHLQNNTHKINKQQGFTV